MPDIDVAARAEDSARPPCYYCREPYSAATLDRHTEPVDCKVCPTCTMMPACYTCRNMYCACEIHQH